MEFSKRAIALSIVALVAPAALTIAGTYYAVKTFVPDDPSDPLTQAKRK